MFGLQRSFIYHFKQQALRFPNIYIYTHKKIPKIEVKTGFVGEGHIFIIDLSPRLTGVTEKCEDSVTDLLYGVLTCC